MNELMFENMTKDELQETDGGIGITTIVVGIMGISALVNTFNGYQETKRTH